MDTLDLNEVVQETVDRFEEQARALGSTLTFKSDRPVKIKGDRQRLEQVLSNVLMNALNSVCNAGLAKVL